MKLMILDGNSVINRAFYGVRLLTTRDGQYTNAIFGFLNILDRMLAQEQPDGLCVAFDLHGPTFRHLRYDGYKATRHGMPEELAQQMPVMKQVLAAMNIPIYACQGWEADDVIGTIAKKAGEAGWDSVIVTGDRDSLQLIDEHVRVKLVVTKGGQTNAALYDTAAFTQEYGFAPIRLIDLKALMGDSSDNIPGVAGVGPKTATDLLTKYGTLDGVYENLTPQNMKGKLFEKLQNGRESAYLSFELATIRLDAPVAFCVQDTLRREPDRAALYDLFTRLEFVKLIDKYHLRGAKSQDLPAEPAPDSAGAPAAGVIRTAADLAALQDACKAWQGRPVGLWAGPGLTPLALCADSEPLVLTAEGEARRAALRALFDGRLRLVAHGSKELIRDLMQADLPWQGIVFDTEVAAYLLDSARGKYELARLAMEYCQIALPDGKEASELAPNELAARNAAAVLALYAPLSQALSQQGLKALYEEVDLPLCPVLAGMEQAGVLVDASALHRFDETLKRQIAAIQAEIYRLAGEEFNVNSPRQLGVVLFEKLGLPAGKKTKTGWSTNVEVLEKLRGKHPIIAQIMDYRTLTKLQSTYADGLLKVIGPDGRVRTTFQNTVTATGRLSSTDPNLQNIPVRTDLGAEIRKMFVPREDWVFVDADYSQIELRVLAHMADDHAMQEAFLSGEDVHRVTASQVFGVPLQDVTPQMRRNAKAVNFGIVYGISEFSLAEDIGVSRYEAKEYIESYLSKYHGIRDFMKNVIARGREDGYVSTLYGRRRYLPELKDGKYMVRAAAERMAMNAPIQGTAADIIKIAMLRVERALREAGLRARLVLQVHDELIVECPQEEAMEVCALVTAQMEQAASLSVPLTAEAKYGASWYAAK